MPLLTLNNHFECQGGICLHRRKTKIWNSQGEKPKCVDMNSEAVVCRGDREVSESQQLEQKADEHKELSFFSRV